MPSWPWYHPARLGALLAMLAVLLGAFASHALEGRISPERLETFETAVRYHMFHALALLGFASLPPRSYRAAGLLLAGVGIFSGSLYLLVLSDTAWLGAITPIGGLLMIAGWLWLFWLLRYKPEA